MLSDYKYTEPIIYRQLKNLGNNLSHAYLFNLNNNVYAEDMVISFVKSILCKDHESKQEYEECMTCKRIDDGNYLELKKIYPDGLSIKKQELDDLQAEFSTKSIESNKRVYMIYDADKLNKSAANSLLKFLEEPNDNVIAILLTNNINQMLETIVSRCRILTFTKNKVEDYIKYNNIINSLTINKLSYTIWKIKDEKFITEANILFVKNLIRFIDKYEQNGIKMLLYTKECFDDCFKEKQEIIDYFKCLILFYRDVLEYTIYGQVIYFDDYLDLIKEISLKNNRNKVISKLNVIIKDEKLIKSNANVLLLVDSMIIDMEDVI